MFMFLNCLPTLQKKQFGKSIANRAPSILLAIINRKLKYFGKQLAEINTYEAKASQFNYFDETYKKKKLSQRWNDFNGIVVLQFKKIYKKVLTRALCYR